MKIILEPKEAEEIFYSSLCNAVGTGYMSGYGIELRTNYDDYIAAKDKLVSNGADTCYEDVLMQILRDGNTLKLVDVEGGEDDAVITLSDVYDRMSDVPLDILVRFKDEQDDAGDADQVLQIVFFKEIIYG